MAINFESLRKIFEFESQKGYDNSVVIGGIDKLLATLYSQTNETDNRLKHLLSDTVLNLRHPQYSSLTIPKRKLWIKQVLTQINNLENSDLKAAEYKMPAKNTKIKTTPAEIPAPKLKSKTSDNTSLDTKITQIKGISSVLEKKFNKLGVFTIRDMLYFFPNRHIDYSQRVFVSKIVDEGDYTIIANVWEAREVRLGLRPATEALVGDETGNIRLVWFNQPYVAKSLTTDKKIIVSGRVRFFNGRPQFESPEWESAEDKDLVHTGRLVPLYPLTQGLSQRQVRRLIKPVVDQRASQLPDFLPASVRQHGELMELSEAIRQAHFPEDEKGKNTARIRLAFDELFLLQLGVLKKKRNWQELHSGHAFVIHEKLKDTFLKSLSYELTDAQKKVLQEILNDLQKTQPMSRLLQGEVGSGKTIVAAIALLMAVANGYQGAFMAPTEILAEQHFKTIAKLLAQVGRQDGEDYIYSYTGFLPHPLTIALLIGDVRQLKKRGIQERIQKGEINIIIGTHALIQKDVEFYKLGLAVVDEQHRFGVAQRSELRQKGTSPHMLVMTATPIPRTLALTLYGDLDLSVIDQLPPGRQTIKTKWLKPEQRDAAYAFIRKQIQNGGQAFIICPLIEESEAIQARAAVEEFERLSQEVFPDLRLGLLHGRLSSSDKDKVMQQFHRGDLDILVSTPVVEVGIDVPNATVMLIESADRFGLSQLHQFRGRVGRGKEQSYCMLLAERPTEIGNARLDLIEKTQNGFVLAEEDLKLRGPGEFFGTRQSGLPDLKMAKLSDVALLEKARKEAASLFQRDPQLKQAQHKLLAGELEKVWRHSSTEWS